MFWLITKQNLADIRVQIVGPFQNVEGCQPFRNYSKLKMLFAKVGSLRIRATSLNAPQIIANKIFTANFGA